MVSVKHGNRCIQHLRTHASCCAQALNSLLFPLAEAPTSETAALQHAMVTSSSVLVLLRALHASNASHQQGAAPLLSPPGCCRDTLLRKQHRKLCSGHQLLVFNCTRSSACLPLYT